MIWLQVFYCRPDSPWLSPPEFREPYYSDNLYSNYYDAPAFSFPGLPTYSRHPELPRSAKSVPPYSHYPKTPYDDSAPPARAASYSSPRETREPRPRNHKVHPVCHGFFAFIIVANPILSICLALLSQRESFSDVWMLCLFLLVIECLTDLMPNFLQEIELKVPMCCSKCETKARETLQKLDGKPSDHHHRSSRFLQCVVGWVLLLIEMRNVKLNGTSCPVHNLTYVLRPVKLRRCYECCS